MPHPGDQHNGRYILCAILGPLAVLSSLFLTRNIDFHVYWYGASAIGDHTRALYGPNSGLGFPMHYRYPPVTYLFFWPLSGLPLYWAGVLWMLGVWSAAVGAVVLAVRHRRLRFTYTAIAAACAYMLAYCVLALRSGNVQTYVIAMILAALLLSDSCSLAAGSLLAVAITFKIWPLFFLPWFLRGNRRAALIWLVPLIFFLWLLPLLVWSPFDYLSLIRQWYDSEFQSATTNSELWYFPGQSLRGVLLRYLTAYTPWIKGFPDVHTLALSPAFVVNAWAMMSAVFYLVVCIAMLRSDGRRQCVWDGLSFALFTALEPFCPKSSMISLGPAVLIGAALCSIQVHNAFEKSARWLFFAACGMSFFGALVQYKPALRLLLALGLDFYAGLLLILALLLWAFRGVPDDRPN